MSGTNGSAKRVKLEVRNLEKNYLVEDVGGRTIKTEALTNVNFTINLHFARQDYQIRNLFHF
ncbi:Uncharacterized [Moorella glycerini]|uniref:Uncharacterized protein n=1 Tax=Neomoorella stamsii TaxID=1266720 RepID=A0A9X7J6E3_9FIRM|nr:hypothetical protein MOST_04330 [Moorella stamsii]CEP66806.1 Uncharacterized [Moorella glycerini]